VGAAGGASPLTKPPQILASRPLWGSTEPGRLSVAFHLGAAAFQLGQEMSRSRWWRGGGRECSSRGGEVEERGI